MSGKPDDVDWLDLGPDPDEGKPPADPRRRYLWYGGVAALAVVALLLTRTQHGVNQAASAPAAPASTARSSSALAPVSSAVLTPDPTSGEAFVDPGTPGPIPSRSPVRVSSTGRPLLDVPADWELFARGEDSLLRIELARGRVSVTALPRADASDTSAVLYVGADRVIIRPMSDSPAVVVRDGKPAAELPTSLQHSFVLLPGPDSRHLWTNLDGGDGLSLVNLDGRPTGTSIDVPAMGSVTGSDGTGYALVSGVGGVYRAQPGAVHRITSGMLLASGPTRWLTVECGDNLSCGLVVTDRATGARHPLDTVVPSFDPGQGVISPDGRTVALPWADGGISSDGIDLVDLTTGAHRSVDVIRSVESQNTSFIWSPDSRWLFTVDAGGRVVVVNRATGRATPLAKDLPRVVQLGLRAGG